VILVTDVELRPELLEDLSAEVLPHGALNPFLPEFIVRLSSPSSMPASILNTGMQNNKMTPNITYHCN